MTHMYGEQISFLRKIKSLYCFQKVSKISDLASTLALPTSVGSRNILENSILIDFQCSLVLFSAASVIFTGLGERKNPTSE